MVALKRWFRPAVLGMEGYKPGEQPKKLSVVKLNTNENPFPPSKAVRSALRSYPGPLLRLYPEPGAETLLARLSKVYHWPEKGILVGNGSDELLSIIFRACLDRGDLVQYPDLTYSLYPVLAALSEARVREAALDADYGLDFRKFRKEARLTLFGYPNPPLGNCFPLGGIRDFCRKARGLVLIDEAYVDFSETNCLALARRLPNVLVLRTVSKSFSLAGVRLGILFGHPEAVEQLQKVKDSYNVNRLTQALGLAAFSPQKLGDINQKVRAIRSERERLSAQLRGMDFSVPESQANFLLALRVKGPKAEFLYKILKKRGVLVRYFTHPRLRDALRITVGGRRQNDRLLRELKKVIFATDAHG